MAVMVHNSSLLTTEMPIIVSANGAVEMQHAGQLIKGILKNYSFSIDMRGGQDTIAQIHLDIAVDTLGAADDVKNVELAKQLIRIVEVLHEPPADV